jgi:hypothetical protein
VVHFYEHQEDIVMVLTTTQDAQMTKNHAEWNGDFCHKGQPYGIQQLSLKDALKA